MRDPANIGLGGCTSLHEFSHWPCAHTQSGKEGYWVHWGVANPKANVMGGGGQTGPATSARGIEIRSECHDGNGGWPMGGAVENSLHWRTRLELEDTRRKCEPPMLRKIMRLAHTTLGKWKERNAKGTTKKLSSCDTGFQDKPQI